MNIICWRPGFRGRFFFVQAAAWLLFSTLALTALEADTVAEWKFDSKDDIPAGSVVKLDKVRKGASDESRLSDHAKVESKSTGISEAWNPFLASGYLEALPGGGIPETGMVEINKHGLYTQADKPQGKNGSYESYFGFSGLGKKGSRQGGTVYLVLSPLDDFKKGTRYGFMGTGHAGEGEIQLGITTEGNLEYRLGTRESLVATLKQKWKPRRWYFVAASWGEDVMPYVYVREMDANGPAASPKTAVSDPAIPGPALTAPKYDPLVIGSNWFNPGAKSSTVYGAGSRIAYARFDNESSTPEDMDKTFESLGAR